MTVMLTPIAAPNPNHEASIRFHKQQVLKAFGPLFDLISSALSDSVPRANDLFRLLNGPVDLGVHASNTRYLTRLFLASQNVLAENEDNLGFEIERVPNCGLCLCGQGYEIRILKSSADGIPKANSDARSRFYSSNQLQFAFASNSPIESQSQMTLNLIVVWSMDSSYSYAGMEIACPRGEKNDGTVDCYWIERWNAMKEVSARSQQTPDSAETDLDEIRVLVSPKAASN